MEDKTEHLLQLLAHHEVPETDQVFWQSTLSNAWNNDSIEGLLDFLITHPTQATWMRQMVEAKVQAIRDGDEDKLVSLIEQEAEYIEALPAS